MAEGAVSYQVGAIILGGVACAYIFLGGFRVSHGQMLCKDLLYGCRVGFGNIFPNRNRWNKINVRKYLQRIVLCYRYLVHKDSILGEYGCHLCCFTRF